MRNGPDQSFVELLWPTRPQLVAAVALWHEVKEVHPEVYRRLVLERKYDAGRALFQTAALEGRLPDPDTVVGLLRNEIEPARERMECHGRKLLQLLRLGWGRWWPKDGTVELPRTAGGGDPMPQWVLDGSPADHDGEAPDMDEHGWWYAGPRDAPEEPLDPLGGRPGVTLRTEAVRAVWCALEAPDVARERSREKVARHLPSSWPELQDSRRRAGDGRDTPLANTLRNAARRPK